MYIFTYTITTSTYISAVQVEVSVGASVAIPAHDVRLTAAVTGEAVTDGQVRFVVQVCAHRVTLAGLATWWISGLVKGQSVAEESRLATFAMESVLYK